jgi:proteic killer suppression protein
MIKSFKHKGLKKFFYTGLTKGIKPDHVQKIARILDRLNAAEELKDMNYPGSGLHSLTGQKKGFHAVSVSGNWRIIFRFESGHVYDIDYLDYH